jgi:hypothetical protein
MVTSITTPCKVLLVCHDSSIILMWPGVQIIQ